MKSIRRLARAPGFAIVVVLTIGLVVGADATIFTALNAVLLRDLAVPEPRQLVRVAAITPRGETHEVFPYADFVALRDVDQTVALAAFTAMRVTAIEPQTHRVESVGTERVSDNFFAVLGAPLARGTSEVVISSALEQRMFGGNALGRAIDIQGKRETITGVAAAPFRGTNHAAPADIWLPLDRRDSDANVRLIGRLRDRATYVAAQESLTRALPDRKRIARVRVGPERAMLINPSMPRAVSIALTIGITLMALSALVAAANVVGVLFARIAMRRRDLMIRVALGAMPGALMRDVMAETLPLAIPAALCAYLVAAVASPLYLAGIPAQSRPAIDISPDARVVTFTLVLSIAAVLFAAVVGALYARRTTVQSLTMRGGSQRTLPILRWIVAVQLALSTVVLIVAGLLVQTARAYRAVDPGFEYDKQLRVMVENIPLPRLREIADGLRHIDGTTAVAIATSSPLSRQTRITVRGRDGEPIDGHVTYIDGDYFAALGVPIVRGTDIKQGVVINEAMLARRPDLVFGGVVRDAHFDALADEPSPHVFLPIEHAPSLATANLLIRTTRDRGTAIRDVDAYLAAHGIPPNTFPLEDSVKTDRWLAETASIVAGALAALTLLLAAIGLFGVISANVTHRSRELAIRAAHGATRGALARLVAAYSARLLLAGAIAGALLAIPAARALASLLFGVQAFDPITWSAVAVLVTITVALATALPVRRAVAVNPVELLKEI